MNNFKNEKEMEAAMFLLGALVNSQEKDDVIINSDSYVTTHSGILVNIKSLTYLKDGVIVNKSYHKSAFNPDIKLKDIPSILEYANFEWDKVIISIFEVSTPTVQSLFKPRESIYLVLSKHKKPISDTTFAGMETIYTFSLVDNDYLIKTINPADELKMELINRLRSLSMNEIETLSEKFSDMIEAIKYLRK
jgi:hypothetical protein